MQIKVFKNGCVVLPQSVRGKFGLRPGDTLDVRVEHGSVVLTPRRKRARKARILVDPITGLPVLSAGPDAPRLTSKEAWRILFR